MEPGMFTPTLDWGNELLTSLVWIAKAWAIAAMGTMVVLVLIARFTTWGRQFWRVTGDYFTGADSVKVWIWLAGMLLSVVAGVRLDVLLLPGQRHADQLPGRCSGPRHRRRRGEGLWQDGFWSSIVVFASWPPVHVARFCWTCS